MAFEDIRETVVLAWKLIEADEFDDLPSHKQDARLGQASGLLCTSLQNLVVDPEFRNQVFIAESRWPPPPSEAARTVLLETFGNGDLQRLADLLEQEGWDWPQSARKWLNGLAAHATLDWLTKQANTVRAPLGAQFLPELTLLQQELCRLSAEFREAVQTGRTTARARCQRRVWSDPVTTDWD
ncbi:MAG: hypothetical protein EKK42_34100 [Pseudonocardiaceae bacterium]|nr:MAG: hypothetical protein EKK42_34100 [Pseudonocardiaceae bacterium]